MTSDNSTEIITKVITKVPRVVDSTIEGKYVKEAVQLLLAKRFKFNKFEEIELLYVNGDNHETTDIDKHVYVGITNYRIFKYDKGDEYTMLRKDIVKCTHEDGGMFHWDKVVCWSNSGSESFGIYEGSTAKYFYYYISKHPFVDPVEVLRKKLEDAKTN